MRIKTLLTLGACALATAAPAVAATGTTGSTGPKGPTAQQVQAAINRAKHSTGLWATINICNTKAHPHTIGIRAQMPALGFLATLQMVVHLNYYSLTTAAFKPLPGASTPLTLGPASQGYHQDGVTFTVNPPATLNATVQFIWKSGTKVLGQTTMTTVSKRTGVQQGDPKGYSAAVCRIT